MKISSSSFDSNYHSSQRAGNHTHGEYIFHNVDVWKTITINDKYKFTALWQCGMSYMYGDYNCPSTELEISEVGGSDELIVLIDSMYESDFDGDVSDELERANKLCSDIKTVDDLFNIYQFLRDERPINVSEFIGSDFESNNLDDYEEDEATGYLIAK